MWEILSPHKEKKVENNVVIVLVKLLLRMRKMCVRIEMDEG